MRVERAERAGQGHDAVVYAPFAGEKLEKRSSVEIWTDGGRSAFTPDYPYPNRGRCGEG